MPEFEETISLKVEALQHSIEEISRYQAEMKSRVLPDWEAGLSLKIKKVKEDVESFEQSMRESFTALEKGSQSRQQELEEEFRALEPRLTPSIDLAKHRIDELEEALERLEAAQMNLCTNLMKNQILFKYITIEYHFEYHFDSFCVSYM